MFRMFGCPTQTPERKRTLFPFMSSLSPFYEIVEVMVSDLSSKPAIAEKREASFDSLSPEVFQVLASQLSYNPDLARLSQASKTLHSMVSGTVEGELVQERFELKSMTNPTPETFSKI